ncbi:hypothetical protein CCYN2B_40073 [Capnocytophaga cynodegmi]|uniref:Uncharacterized protein n=1 Tax=Capnocytophaga cynodegmi TaxID=28189 RepID=A0A0B7HFB1_9FLAO|nr:hypothetical protein CCYN2B_40073 [Capnocytophaga cynodegmi]
MIFKSQFFYDKKDKKISKNYFMSTKFSNFVGLKNLEKIV